MGSEDRCSIQLSYARNADYDSAKADSSQARAHLGAGYIEGYITWLGSAVDPGPPQLRDWVAHDALPSSPRTRQPGKAEQGQDAGSRESSEAYVGLLAGNTIRREGKQHVTFNVLDYARVYASLK